MFLHGHRRRVQRTLHFNSPPGLSPRARTYRYTWLGQQCELKVEASLKGVRLIVASREDAGMRRATRVGTLVPPQ